MEIPEAKGKPFVSGILPMICSPILRKMLIAAQMLVGCLMVIPAQAGDATPIRVMSFNIRYGTAKDGENSWTKRRDFLVETIRQFEPDLLGTQETLADQKDFLAEKLAGYEAHGVGRDDGKLKGEMAALFFRRDRFEKIAGGHFWLSESPDTVGKKGWDAALPRIVSWVKLKESKAPDELPLLFLNTHFDHMGVKAREESSRLIRSKITELGQGCRVVVTGDFNAGEGSKPYLALFGMEGKIVSPVKDTLRAYRPTRGKKEGTFTAFNAANQEGERIDWIGCSQHFEVRTAGIDRTQKEGTTPSDHFAVTAVLRAKGKPGEKRTLRVLCYNIHHGRGTDDKVDLPRLAKVIGSVDADVVALQEVDNKTKRTGGVDQTAELARLTELNGLFGRQIDFQGGTYGQAVLSRFAISGSNIHVLPGEPDRETRIAFETRMDIYGKDHAFVSTHLHHQSQEFRVRQAEKIVEVFGNVGVPVIVAGDLNAYPNSEPLKVFKKEWGSATGGKAIATFPAPKPVNQIDYILFKPKGSFSVQQVKVLDEPVASDHRPILAVLEVEGQ